MIRERNNLGFLDVITILSFVVSLYALYIALQNLDENRLQTADTQRILDDLENHLKSQDLHLVNQDKILENLTK